MKKPDLAASVLAGMRQDTTPDIEGIHARVTQNEDRSTWKRLNIRIPEDLLNDLKKLAIDQRTTPENISLDLIRQYLNQEKKS